MKKRSHLEKQFKINVMHCIDLRSKEKKSWLESMDLLSDEVLLDAVTQLQKTNMINDECIRAALSKDKNQHFLKEIKAKFKEIKTKVFQQDEEKTKLQSENLLNTELENI